ncbi:MAG: hypothetical protein J0652_02415 [Desulfobulbaceae bacterium]|nr:hypothetical protein [Desulfobulbaceae bacterium]
MTHLARAFSFEHNGYGHPVLGELTQAGKTVLQESVFWPWNMFFDKKKLKQAQQSSIAINRAGHNVPFCQYGCFILSSSRQRSLITPFRERQRWGIFLDNPRLTFVESYCLFNS